MFNDLPTSIEQVFINAHTPEAIFLGLMPALGKFLKSDRCFLYLRDPETCLGMVPFSWMRNETIPKIYDTSWKLEPDDLSRKDPMFAAALRTEPSIFVDDISIADVKTLNRQFENQSFGHRALIHAHLCQDNQLWGILQPCVFNHARHWTQTEQQVVNQTVQIITPLAIDYIVEMKTVIMKKK